jgi:hypothetical protein
MQVDNPLNRVIRSDLVKPIAKVPLAIVRQSKDDKPMAPLDQSRIDQIRSKILSGAYHSLATAEQVARHILQSGDIIVRAAL